MTTPNDALTLQLLEWIQHGGRGYSETLEAWRSTCPRLSIWEDACADGLIAYEPDSRTVSLTDKGRARLAANVS
jgi:hypothetical protein